MNRNFCIEGSISESRPVSAPRYPLDHWYLNTQARLKGFYSLLKDLKYDTKCRKNFNFFQRESGFLLRSETPWITDDKSKTTDAQVERASVRTIQHLIES